MSWLKDHSPDQKAEAEVRAPLCCPGSQATTRVRGASVPARRATLDGLSFLRLRGSCSWDKVHSWRSRGGGSHSDPDAQRPLWQPGLQQPPPPHHALTRLPSDERAELVETPCPVTNVETTSVLLVVTTEGRGTVSPSRPGARHQPLPRGTSRLRTIPGVRAREGTAGPRPQRGQPTVWGRCCPQASGQVGLLPLQAGQTQGPGPAAT